MKDFREMSHTAQQILDIAEDLIRQQGYNGFSYNDISRMVGIRKPSIHHHFPTKAELVEVLVQRYNHRFHEQLLRIEAGHVRTPGRLMAYAALFDNTFIRERHLCVCGMLGAEAGSLPKNVTVQVEKFFRSSLDWLTRIIAEGQKNKLIRPEPDAEALARAFLSILEGAMVVGRGISASGPPSAAGNSLLSMMLV